MTLQAVDPDTLYLYIEQDHGHALVIFDVTSARRCAGITALQKKSPPTP